MIDLSVLQTVENRRTVLMAELAGWLHLIGKMQRYDRQCDRDRLTTPKFSGRTPTPEESVVMPEYNSFQDPPLAVGGEETSVGTMAMCWKSGLSGSWPGQLPGLFLACHEAAHLSKFGEATHRREFADGVEERVTVFGHRLGKGTGRWDATGWANALAKVNHYSAKPTWERRASFIGWFRKNLGFKCEENREPHNDMTLPEYSGPVAALFRTAVAKAVIENAVPQGSAMKWRLLGARVNGLAYLARANAVPDIVARRAMLENGFDAVRRLLEYEYPIGCEIYRDENGPVFVVPDLKDVSDSDWPSLSCGGRSLDTVLREAFAGTDPALDIVPKVIPTAAATGNQLPIREAVAAYPAIATADPGRVQVSWARVQRREVCTICGLRPQAAEAQSKGAYDQGICEECHTARNGRCRAWVKDRRGPDETIWLDEMGTPPAPGTPLTERQPGKTIWLDEIADENGRCALIAGRFDLDDWLEGTLIRTLKAGVRYAEPPLVPPEPTWKEDSFIRIQGVWKATQGFWQRVAKEGLKPAGKKIRLRLKPEERLGHLIPDYAYEAEAQGIRLGVVWTGADFITAGNLAYFGRTAIDESVRLLSGRCEIYESRGYERRHQAGRPAERRLGGTRFAVTVDADTGGPIEYRPVAVILKEPQTFLAAAPAAAAVEIARTILTAFDQEFEFVRDRIALGLGLVYFQRRTPLYAAVNAARRMLEMPLPERGVPVSGDDPFTYGPLNGNKWYGYRRIEGGGIKAQLQAGDRIQCAETRVDWTFLSSAGDRFGVAYRGDGRRLDEEDRPRAYTRTEFERVEEIWRLLKDLNESQIRAVAQRIEEKREEWGRDYPAEFRSFAQAAVRNLHWPGGTPDQGAIENLIEAAQDGLLRECIALHMVAARERQEQEPVLNRVGG